MKRLLLPLMIAGSTLGFSSTSVAGPHDDMVGGITLEENFKLAKEFPTPSAWLLANTCSACHGTNGAEFNELMPPLAGIDKEEFIKMMQRFKHEDPNNFIVMGIITQPLTDEEIELMADYFSKQEPKEWTQPGWNEHKEEHK